ncbi:MAG: hypothetical protein WC525_06000 [Candidatus Thermoplasmatota archaeon]
MVKKYVRVCPECNSTDTQPDLSAESYAKGLLNQWKCNTCGYAGVVFPEYRLEDVKKIQAKKNKKA